ncbi:MAG: hypothetical protein PVF93_11835 [Chromatiaceae bacterium]|jgi:hypothetical protein
MASLGSLFKAALHHQRLRWAYVWCHPGKRRIAITFSEERFDLDRDAPPRGHVWNTTDGDTLNSSAIRTIVDSPTRED